MITYNTATNPVATQGNEEGEERNCAFQYAKMSTGILRNTTIVCDKSELTLDEAKELWDKYYKDAAMHICKDGEVEMVIWVNMPDSHSYGDTLQYISTDAESDGIDIWETTKKYFPKNISTIQTNK